MDTMNPTEDFWLEPLRVECDRCYCDGDCDDEIADGAYETLCGPCMRVVAKVEARLDREEAVRS